MCLAKKSDLILMDIRMPEMDGIQACKEILNHYSDEKPPWITALTANVFREDRLQYYKVGFSDFMGKPILKAITNFLTGHSDLKMEFEKQQALKFDVEENSINKTA